MVNIIRYSAMKKLTIILLFHFLLKVSAFSQVVLSPDQLKDSARLSNGTVVQGKIVDNDTIIMIDIPMVSIAPPARQFASFDERWKYERLVKYVKHVYPYSQMIKKIFGEVQAHLDSMPKRSDQKKYLKSKEDELRAKFEKQLVNLTVTEGRILMKLVDRELGSTTYDVVKTLKGSLSAFFWQSLALMFGSNLKTRYAPAGEDQLIEEIINQIENGQL